MSGCSSVLLISNRGVFTGGKTKEVANGIALMDRPRAANASGGLALCMAAPSLTDLSEG
jgi:hypothetical protein